MAKARHLRPAIPKVAHRESLSVICWQLRPPAEWFGVSVRVAGGVDPPSFGAAAACCRLGTANTVVYRRARGSSCSSRRSSRSTTDGQRLCGRGRRAADDRANAGVHLGDEPLRDGVIADFEMTEQMLRQFIRKAAGRARLRADVIVCVPSGITAVERTAVARAARAAGATHAYLIDEPMAAAIGAGLPVAEPRGAMVVDIGGGTTETAVTSLGSLAVVHSIKVGGYQMDDAIVRSIQRRERLLIGQEQAEALKIEIGSAGPPPSAKEQAPRSRAATS